MLSVINSLMLEKNITPSQFCKMTGLRQSSLCDWKSGKSKPAVATLIKLADFFNVSVDYLLGRTKNREPYRL